MIERQVITVYMNRGLKKNVKKNLCQIIEIQDVRFFLVESRRSSQATRSQTVIWKILNQSRARSTNVTLCPVCEKSDGARN